MNKINKSQPSSSSSLFLLLFTISWYCHMDDDVYLIMENVVRVLDTFKPKTEQVYLGRPGKAWRTPFKVGIQLCVY